MAGERRPICSRSTIETVLAVYHMPAVDAVLARGGKLRLHRFVTHIEELEALMRVTAVERLQDKRIEVIV